VIDYEAIGLFATLAGLWARMEHRLTRIEVLMEERSKANRDRIQELEQHPSLKVPIRRIHPT
jgi:hypothetical protein